MQVVLHALLAEGVNTDANLIPFFAVCYLAGLVDFVAVTHCITEPPNYRNGCSKLPTALTPLATGS